MPTPAAAETGKASYTHIPSVLRSPEKVTESTISPFLSLMQAGLDKLAGKLQAKLEAASLTPFGGPRAGFSNDSQAPVVSVRAADLLGMVQTLDAVLNMAAFKKAANQASAAAANRDTLRQLGDVAGRGRRKSGSVGMSSMVDADIANYVLDEFASARQLSAADVAAADEAGSVTSKARRASMGSLAPLDPAQSPSPDVEASGDGDDSAPTSPPTALQEEVAATSAALAKAEKAALTRPSPRGGRSTTASKFQMGVSAVDRLLHASVTIAADAVDKQAVFASGYLARVAPSLGDAERRSVLGMLGEVGEWDLDVLELERAVTFPRGLQAARAAALAGEGAVASASAAPGGTPAADPSAPTEAVGSAGSGGEDGLAGVRRLALPFLGSVLLRRHGFLLAKGETPADARAAAKTGLAAVSLKSPVPGKGAGAGGAGGAGAADPGDASLLLPEGRVLPFLHRLADGYRSNPYHSATHAIDVMYTAHCVVLSPHLHGVIKPEHRMAMLLGAALHDFRHDGTTNALHAKLHSSLALRYNDISVLESMHVSEAFALMRSGAGELDVLADLSRDQQRRIREAVVDTVLATDMRFHFKALEDFEVNVLPIVRSYHAEVVNVMSEAMSVKRRRAASRLDGGAEATPAAASLPSGMSDDGAESPRPDARRSVGGSAVAAAVGAGLAARYRFGGAIAGAAKDKDGKPKRGARLSVVSAPVAELQEHSMVIAKLAMHAADVSNPVKPLPIYRKWAARCMSEFYHVGDCEREAGLPVSTFFDRKARNMGKCQIGFISFVVRPLFAALSELVSDHADNWKATLDSNQAYFEARVAAGETDDDACEGDWFEFDPTTARPGACIASPFDLP